MKYKYQFINPALLTVILALSLGTISAADTHERSAKPKLGKSALITLSELTNLGDIKLEPGTYQIVHRNSDGDHYLEIRRAPYINGSPQVSSQLFAKVKCAIEQLDKKNGQTAVTSEDLCMGRDVKKIEIHGENAAHVFGREAVPES